MSRLDKLQSALVFLAVAAGVLAGMADWIRGVAGHLITPSLMVLLFGVFLQVRFAHLGRAFRNFRPAATTLAVNFLWTPLFAWALGAAFLGGHPDLWVGLLMLMVTPCTDWYLIFTAMARGNLAFSTALLPVNLALQLLLLPVYLFLLGGTVIDIEARSLAVSILLVLVVPFAAAAVFRKVLRSLAGERSEGILVRLTHLPLYFLLVAIAAMFAAHGEAALRQPGIFVLLLAPVTLFFLVNFVLDQLLGRLLGFSYEDTASLTMTTLARNSPLALAVAATTFPDRPLIALALVIGPLIELPILAVAAQGLLGLRRTREAAPAV
ncbi:MAG: bile acid:sodium symporter [Thermoleophilia bacterium]